MIKMNKEVKQRCKYCAKYNGDHFDDESERYDYYSCELKNEQELKKYGGYGSKDNEVFEDDCLYPFCDTCQFKDELDTFDTFDKEKQKLRAAWNELIKELMKLFKIEEMAEWLAKILDKVKEQQ